MQDIKYPIEGDFLSVYNEGKIILINGKPLPLKVFVEPAFLGDQDLVDLVSFLVKVFFDYRSAFQRDDRLTCKASGDQSDFFLHGTRFKPRITGFLLKKRRRKAEYIRSTGNRQEYSNHFCALAV